MKTVKTESARRSLTTLSVAVLIWTLSFVNIGSAQIRSSRMIDAGTTITVRTNETIDARDSDGRVFTGVIEGDVRNRNGNIAIPRGSDVELVVRQVSDNEVALDLDSVMINGQRYAVQSESNVLGSSEQKEGLGTNKRTGKYVGGGAAIGAIIGAITGGGKGAAIGAGAGAAAGAGAQVLTRGKSVRVPAESLLTFRLTEPLRAGMVDSGYMNNGVHYHSGYPDAYREDVSRNSGSYRNDVSRSSGSYSNGQGSVVIGSNKNVRWEGPKNSSVYVLVDNEAPRLFAAGQSGTQQAPWISEGHVYVFVLKDANGNEIARDRQDLRTVRRSRYGR